MNLDCMAPIRFGGRPSFGFLLLTPRQNRHFLGGAVLDQLATNIAANLKRLREARQMSQQRLSDVSGVPRPTLANLESGGANPTLSVMLKVSEALQVPLEELLRQPVPAISHRKAAALPSTNRAGVSVVRLMGEASAGHGFERVQLKPQARWSVRPQELGSRFYLYCEMGEVLLTASGESCAVRAGETAILNSDLGFAVTNRGKKHAIVFRVTTPAPPLG